MNKLEQKKTEKYWTDAVVRQQEIFWRGCEIVFRKFLFTEKKSSLNHIIKDLTTIVVLSKKSDWFLLSRVDGQLLLLRSQTAKRHKENSISFPNKEIPGRKQILAFFQKYDINVIKHQRELESVGLQCGRAMTLTVHTAPLISGH